MQHLLALMGVWLAVATPIGADELVPQGQKESWMQRLLQPEASQIPKEFMTSEFRLLWAREAYRAGNIEGALSEWTALAEEDNPIAIYVLQLLTPKS